MAEDPAVALHRKHHGKLVTEPVAPLTPESLALFYTPGVAAVSRMVAANPAELDRVSLRGNLVAVISDGSAVLGLGNIGPEGAYPVMEGKAMLFKSLAGVDAIPIVLNVHTVEQIVEVVAAIAPSFAGINLEDIAAPLCYEIERQLQERLTIPVMHDDQHATAIVVLAGLRNAAKVTGRTLEKMRVVVLGAGAAGSAVARLLREAGIRDLVVVDSKGILSPARTELDPHKQQLVQLTNPEGRAGHHEDAMQGADVVIGLAQGGLLKASHIQSMASKPIVFALSNPAPEILPEEARAAGAAVVATGRSDFANQINNVLVFPGFFRGALDGGVRRVTNPMKLAVAQALADLVPNPTPDNIMPSVFDSQVVQVVAASVRQFGDKMEKLA
jgi:malate dehydrogenase (oxaloacetate-decarboxylating)